MAGIAPTDEVLRLRATLSAIAPGTALRDGLEATYRELARSEDDAARSHAWVDRANAVRRWTTR